jgi:hypothetical protein
MTRASARALFLFKNVRGARSQLPDIPILPSLPIFLEKKDVF